MNVDQKLKKLKNWAGQHNVAILEGTYELKNITQVTFPSEDDEKMDGFLNLIKKLDLKFLVLDPICLSEEQLANFDLMFHDTNDLTVHDKLKSLATYKEDYLGFCCIIFSEGIAIRYNYYSPETDYYLEIIHLANRLEKSTLRDNKFLSEDDIQKYALLFVNSDEYSKLKNRSQRENYAVKVFGNDLQNLKVDIKYGIREIVGNAEILYETQIKPQKEKELKGKIAELLNRGYSKVKIMSELNLSKDAVNRLL